MGRILHIFFLFCLISNSFSEESKEKKEDNDELYSSLKNIASIVLDFVSLVNNIKGGYEAVKGKDPLTGANLTTTERAFSFLGAVPFLKILKGGKHLKKAQKFEKAAERAAKIGKLKNAAKLAKASERAMKNPGVQKNIKTGIEFIKTASKFYTNKTENESESENEENTKF